MLGVTVKAFSLYRPVEAENRTLRTRPQPFAGNQPDAALPGAGRPRPFRQDRDAVSKTDQPEDVQEQPEHPCEETGRLDRTDVYNSRSPTDDRPVAVVAISERQKRLAANRAQYVFRGMPAALHRH